MPVIDFANSYMTFFGKNRGNIARIQLDAACALTDETSGASEVFYLIAPCRAERMYLETQLFQMPNYEFCGIFSNRDCLLIRTHWASERDNREYGLNRGRFDDVHLDVRTFPSGRPLGDVAAIVAATLDNRPLVARTELRDPGRGLRAVLEYPVKTMNVLREPPRFQVDTGPLILPDFTSTAEHLIERLGMAYAVYNGFDRAEFIRREPTTPPAVDRPFTRTTDYSLIEILSARNEIVCAG
ncbi:MAG TPA: hypothetical protein VG370_15095 [Chloroflexota bacterium]|jgi:hypothetical protein|nr:hypothetical protein [Chloroflexota bacterium]